VPPFIVISSLADPALQVPGIVHFCLQTKRAPPPSEANSSVSQLLLEKLVHLLELGVGLELDH
jgi:hypothetical protein